ncbi:MAG: DNA cytosine methyltransferase [Planctomycetota bacterium]|nr:DNA cytosine methyltransferase [Planctomycetota bacterium]
MVTATNDSAGWDRPNAGAVPDCDRILELDLAYSFSAIVRRGSPVGDWVFEADQSSPENAWCSSDFFRSSSRNMFPHAIRAVREKQPRAFVFENVKGLLRDSFSNYYQYIIHQLRFPELTRNPGEEWTHHLSRLEKMATHGTENALQYNVIYHLMNAADFGVPQHRHRVLIVGIRSDLQLEFSFPQPTHEHDALLYDKWVTGEYWDRHCLSKRVRPTVPDSMKNRVSRLRSLFPEMLLPAWRTVRDAIADLPEIALGASCSKFSNRFCNPGARSYAGHTGSPYDEPAKALKAGDHGVPGGENTLRYEDGSVRYFSVRECARIQTFPDEWTFEGSWTESMRQLGNAVPVHMCETVAIELHRILSRKRVAAHA